MGKMTSKVYQGNIKKKDPTLPALSVPLAFVASAMIFVNVEKPIRDSEQEKHLDIETFGALIGFVAMMIPDVALG
jgi:zinc transporter ZupT